MIISLLLTSPVFTSIYLLGSEWETHTMKMENVKRKRTIHICVQSSDGLYISQNFPSYTAGHDVKVAFVCDADKKH